MAHVLGVDLGTTNSAVAVADDAGVRVLTDAQGYPLIPSVVSFHPSGDVLVGRDAKERRLVDAANTVYSTKRLIGRPYRSAEVQRAKERFPFELAEGEDGAAVVRARGEEHTLAELAAFVLRKIRKVAEAALKESTTRAVVTVPANFSELQRSATKAAGSVAGLEVLRILNEPTAAALAYGYGKGMKERVAVFDFGGGTFDLTILDLAGDVFEVLATAGDTFLGGDDIDLLIAEQMADAFLQHHRYDARSDPQAFERLRAAAEWAKCELSAKPEVQLRVEDLAYGDGGKGLHLKFRLKRETLEGMAGPLLARAFDVCEEAFAVAKLRPSQLDNVILVGGSTRIPLVQRMVEQYFGTKPLSDIDPELVVARGAAVQARVLGAGARAPIGKVTLRSVPVPRAARGVTGGVSEEYAFPSVAFDDATEVGGKTDVDDAAEATVVGALDEVSGRLTAGYDDQTAVRPPVSAPPAPSAGARSVPPGGAGRSLPPPVPSARVPGSPGSTLRPSAPGLAPSLRPSGPPGRAPLLLDVTPLSLGVETVEGYCEAVIPRNSAIPAEQSRVYATARDNQGSVRVRVCQGESRRLAENQPLGEFVLMQLPAGARGTVKISVTFLLDASGMLQVSAKDLATGRRQAIEVNLLGGYTAEDLEKMRARQDQRNVRG